jgi:hypothetical protein
LLHAKGFIINKLFDDGRIGHKHLPVGLLPKGYPPKYRHLVMEAFEVLKAENHLPSKSSDIELGEIHLRVSALFQLDCGLEA